MKAVVLFGSPRKEGNTIQLVKVLTDTLKSKGHNVRMLYLNDLNIRPCQGCYQCLPKGICRIHDDMKDIRKYIIESDLIVYATPLYWFGPSGQLKLAIDRSISFMDKEYNSRIKGKKVVTIMTCGSEDAGSCQPALDMFRKTFDLLGLSSLGNIEATGCEDTGEVKAEFKEKTRELAETIA
ncbi:MAG: putative NAD(P)H-dependent FMN-containing oxidoreductase YwqN [Syntrophorhabdus sp. PtaU1.Bin050]|nr:MAG: putative NAD(P)H-dependent FMN-containing oxidoreductase YwqN [Syntrophorhabdus sp. PtaU1.Bin050]